jgi:hypothetical protein
MVKTAMELVKELSTWAALGYDITLTTKFGKDFVRMEYRNHPDRKVVCEQVCEHDSVPEKFHSIVNFMFEDIQKQIKTGEFYEPW